MKIRVFIKILTLVSVPPRKKKNWWQTWHWTIDWWNALSRFTISSWFLFYAVLLVMEFTPCSSPFFLSNLICCSRLAYLVLSSLCLNCKNPSSNVHGDDQYAQKNSNYRHRHQYYFLEALRLWSSHTEQQQKLRHLLLSYSSLTSLPLWRIDVFPADRQPWRAKYTRRENGNIRFTNRSSLPNTFNLKLWCLNFLTDRTFCASFNLVFPSTLSR